MDYKKLLEKAKSSIPEDASSDERFEIPSAFVMTQGNRTIIKNFSNISSVLRRKPEHIAKFLFSTLGMKGNINDQTLELNGKARKDMINNRIKEYTDKYVICLECGKADTTMEKQGKIIRIKCEACGAKRTEV